MAINTTDQNEKLQQTNEQLRARSNLPNIINQDMFGVLNTERKLVVDSNSLIQLQDLDININYKAQIRVLGTQIGVIDTQITPLKALLATERARNASAEALASGVDPKQVAAMTTSISNDIQRKISDITNQITALENKKAPLETQKIEYENIDTTYAGILGLRSTELANIRTAANNFDLTKQIPNSKVINYKGDCDFGGTNSTNLEAVFRKMGTLNIDYNLCNNISGDVLSGNNSQGRQISTASGQTITLRGLEIGGTPTTLTGKDISIDPVDGVTFPLNLEIGVRGRIIDNTINIDTYKTIHLTINAPQLSDTKRKNAYDLLNTGNSVNGKIDSLYAASNTAREDDVIWEMLAAGGNKDEVEAARKDPVKSKEFIRRARASGITIPIINLPSAHSGFKTYITDDKRKVDVQHLVDEEHFRDYIRNNLDKSIEEYLKKDIRKQIDINTNRDKLLGAFIETNTVLTQGEREAAYNDLNTGNTINDRINIEHTNNNTAREDEVIREIIGESGAKGEMEALRKDEVQAKEFIKKIRSLIHPPVVNIATLQSGFKSAMIDPTRKVPEEYLITQEKFKDYLATDLDKNIVDHLKKSIKKNLDIPANRGIMMRELLNFQTELKNNKIDSTVDQDALGDLAGVQMDSKRWLPLFGRKDVNYMRFFSGASVDMGAQTVNLNKEVKYAMNLKISGKNEIMATVKIGDKKEKTYKAGNPMAMIEKILKEKEIPEGKTRLHVAYNIIAGMIQIAKNEDISLSYRDAAGHNQVIKLDGKNIILEDQDDLTNHATGRRVSKTLFDYSLFESTNSFEDPNRSGRHVLTPDNRTLRRGLEVLTKHFNVAMNQVNANYDCATERKGGILRSNTSSDFPSSAWTSPIKKLLNCKTTTNFDFATSVNHNGKSVQIERKGNTFFLTIDGVELKGKDLGKLLKKRKGGIRLFDGVERAICGEIYKNMVEKLRTNTKIARSSFGVMDPKTGRMYIIDEDGQLGYLRAEEADVEKSNLKTNPGVNTAANIALAGGLGAAGIATGGAAALAAGLSWGAAGTAASWGAMTAPGVAIFKDIRRIVGRGYGTLDHAPAARTMCDEAETREIYKDPFLMGKLMKVMNLRLGQL